MKAYVVEKEALSHNIELLQKMANGVPIWAVLKGNGYGIGVLPLARHLAEAGIDHFCVTEVREAELLRENGFEEDLVMDLIEKAAGRGAPGMPVQGLTPRCRRVIEIAVAEANRLRHSYVGTEHLLMGILREPESTAAHLLTAAGGDLNKIYTDVFTRFTSSDYRAAARSGAVRAAALSFSIASGNAPTPGRSTAALFSSTAGSEVTALRAPI